MTDDPNQQEQIEEAFGSVHEWRGKSLQPFSSGRMAAFQRLGYDRVESEFEAATGIVFLCLIDPAITEQGRGEKGCAYFRRLHQEWMDEQGLTFNNAEGIECVKLGTAIWNETKVSRFRPDAKATASPNG